MENIQEQDPFGLLGRGLSHSLSPRLHAFYGAYPYRLFDLPEEALPAFFAARAFRGINVTIPYKHAVIPYLDALSAECESLQSVNTIVRRADGSLIGHNTDYYGFCYMCRRAGIAFSGKICAVLGNGGVAPTVRAALRDGGAREIITVSGHGEIGYADVHRFSDAQILVNTTPVGMYPRPHESVVDITTGFPQLEAVVDLIYNPEKTKLLEDAKARGLQYTGGISMLCAQGAKASELFTGIPVPAETLERAVRYFPGNI